MKKSLMTTVLVGAIAAGSFAVFNVSAEPALDNPDQKASYGMGLALGERMKHDLPDLQMDQFIQGVRHGLSGEESPRMSKDEIQASIQQYQKKVQKKQMAKMEKQASDNKEKGEAFLEKNAKKDGVKTTDSGLEYKVVEKGDGPKPEKSDSVKVHYTGKLLNGEVFDSSRERGKPVTFQLSQVIKGWTEGLQLMNEGSRYTLYVPADLAYGPGGNRSIGPNETLIFDVELLKVNPKKGDKGDDQQQ